MRAKPKLHRRTKPRQQRSDELLDSAQRLFLKQGVGATTIDQITSAAQVAKGTFYLHFSSKEDVLAALSERFAQELLLGIKTAVDQSPTGNWKRKLATWAKAGVSGYLDAMPLHDILFYGSRPLTGEGLVDNVIIDHLMGLLRGGNTAGAWSIDDPRLTAVFLFSGLHGVVDDVHAKRKGVDRSRLARKLEQLCFRAVGLG